MKKFAITVLTIECVKALNAFAEERAEHLIGCAEFKPSLLPDEDRKEMIKRQVINAVKQLWITPGYETTCFTELPDNLIVPMYETHTIKSTMDAFTLMQGQQLSTPMFEWQGAFLEADIIPEILTYKEMPLLAPNKEGEDW